MSAGQAELRRWRKRAGIETMVAAADRLGVPWWKYRRWEMGERTPDVEDALMLERICGIAISKWITKRTGTEG